MISFIIGMVVIVGVLSSTVVWYRKGKNGTGISLLVPFRSDSGWREEVWDWLEKYWKQELPKAQLIMGNNDNTPFCKTAAVNSAFRKAKGDVIVILDSDCYLQGEIIQDCADRIRQAREKGHRLWFIPYRHFYRLTQAATLRVLKSSYKNPYRFSVPPSENDIESREGSSFGHWYGALIQIMPREAFITAGGMDERFCVDEETEILTADGWKRHPDVHKGSQVLTLNHETGMSEWQPVQSINVFAGPHELLSIESKTHSSLTTLNHRWPIIRRPDHRPGTGWGSKQENRTWTISGNIKSEDSVPTAALCADLPTEPKYSDGLVSTIAWFWTEGSISRLRDGSLGRSVTISQSHVVNPENCERIEAALTAAFGPASEFPRRGKSSEVHPPRWRRWLDGRNTVYALNAEAGELVQQYAPYRVPSKLFLRMLTSAQLELFIADSIRADGCTRASQYEVSLTQKNPAATEAFQFACILAGHATTTWTDPDLPGYDYGMTGVRIRQQRKFKLIKGKHKIVNYTGNVWCPTTPNGTWLARRHGKVYFTGNSGWGGEDVSFMRAVDTLWARHKTTGNQVLHMWHPRIGNLWKERKWEGQDEAGNNNELAWRYNGANGIVDQMQRLVDERHT